MIQISDTNQLAVTLVMATTSLQISLAYWPYCLSVLGSTTIGLTKAILNSSCSMLGGYFGIFRYFMSY